MTGHCILLGFRRGGGSGPGRFEEWAAENLTATGDIPKKEKGVPYSEWTKENFVTITGNITPPESERKFDILVAWAKENFVTVNENGRA